MDIEDKLSKTLMLSQEYAEQYKNKSKKNYSSVILANDLLKIDKYFFSFKDVHLAMAYFNDNNGKNQAKINKYINKAIIDIIRVTLMQSQREMLLNKEVLNNESFNLMSMFVKKIQIEYLLAVKSY